MPVHLWKHQEFYLEVVSDLTTDTFIFTFRRFASHKSLPQIMMSDNMSSYISC